MSETFDIIRRGGVSRQIPWCLGVYLLVVRSIIYGIYPTGLIGTRPEPSSSKVPLVFGNLNLKLLLIPKRRLHATSRKVPPPRGTRFWVTIGSCPDHRFGASFVEKDLRKGPRGLSLVKRALYGRIIQYALFTRKLGKRVGKHLTIPVVLTEY